MAVLLGVTLLFTLGGTSACITDSRLLLMPHLGPLRVVGEYDLREIRDLSVEKDPKQPQLAKVMFGYANGWPDLGDPVPRAQAEALAAAIARAVERVGGTRPSAVEVTAPTEPAPAPPQHPNAHESLAEFLMRDGKNDEALQAAERAIGVDPAFVSSWAVIADIKLKSGDLTGARAQWAKGVQAALFAPDSVDMMHATALSYLTEKDSRTAMTRLGEVAASAESNRLIPRAALIHQQMAAIDAFYGDGRSVAGHLAKAAQVGGSNTAGLHVYSAIAYAAARQLDSARAAAQRFAAVATDANRATVNTLNGFIALQANDAAAAVTALTQANPNDVLSKELLAEAQLKQGRRAEAGALRDAVLKNSTMVAGGRVLDLFILVAQQRAKT